MIVSRKDESRLYWVWRNLEGIWSRLSGPSCKKSYRVNSYWHRLYGRSYNTDWDLNNKFVEIFKEV